MLSILQETYRSEAPVLRTLEKAVDLRACGGLRGIFNVDLNWVIFEVPRMMPPEFAALHHHVGSLSHVPHEKHGSAVATFQRFQGALEWVFYDPSPDAENITRRCFVPEGELELQTWPAGRPVGVTREDSLSHGFEASYNFALKLDGEETVKTVRTVFEEQELVRCAYIDESLYSRLGRELSRVLDVALVKGGLETVMETLYSVMGGQRLDGGQSNETLVHCTEVDWSLPSVIAVHELIERAAERHLEKTRAPIMAYTSRRTQRPPMVSRVITRVSPEKGRAPILKQDLPDEPSSGPPSLDRIMD